MSEHTDALREALALLNIVADVHHKSSDERYTAEKELIRAIHRLASPTVAPADERERFEARFTTGDAPTDRRNFRRFGEGYYEHRIQALWEGWQAAIESTTRALSGGKNAT